MVRVLFKLYHHNIQYYNTHIYIHYVNGAVVNYTKYISKRMCVVCVYINKYMLLLLRFCLCTTFIILLKMLTTNSAPCARQRWCCWRWRWRVDLALLLLLVPLLFSLTSFTFLTLAFRLFINLSSSWSWMYNIQRPIQQRTAMFEMARVYICTTYRELYSEFCYWLPQRTTRTEATATRTIDILARRKV